MSNAAEAKILLLTLRESPFFNLKSLNLSNNPDLCKIEENLGIFYEFMKMNAKVIHDLTINGLLVDEVSCRKVTQILLTYPKLTSLSTENSKEY